MMDTETIAAAVVRAHFPPRRWAVCQNVSWALLPYEADIIATTEAGTVHEVEIKLTKADLRADTKKTRWRVPQYQNLVDFYWLAVPESLKDEAVARAEEIGGGVFSVYRYGDGFLCDKIKSPQRWLSRKERPLVHPYHGNPRLNTEEIRAWRHSLPERVYRLAALRYWDIVFARNKRKENASCKP